LPKCRFTTRIGGIVDFYCDDGDPSSSGFCIFHDKDYLQDKTNNEEHKRKVLERLKNKVNRAISNNEQLLCIGFHLPDFRLKLTKFTKPVYFSGSQFFGKADFSGVNFEGKADFSKANFEERASFNNSEFYGKNTSQGVSMVKQNLIMYYLCEKRKLSLI
jgi:hypothetical protein